MITVIYDGNCVLCRQSKRIITALDWLHRVEWLDLNEWGVVSQRYPKIDYEAAMGQVHTVDEDGGITGGFFGLRRLLRELPLGIPVWALLHVPGASWIGQRVYRFIARNRYNINRLVGAPVCENGVCKLHG